MNNDDGYIVGIDVGGTKILSVSVDGGYEILDSDQRETDGAKGPDAVIERMVESALAAAGSRKLRAVGISMAGSCDPRRGLVTMAPNLTGWLNVPLAQRISGLLGVPTWVDNDANLAALAEHKLGAGKGSQHVLLIAIGTGIGGGLILDGRLYYGASGGAGEIGHLKVIDDGPPCGCGRRGCIESLASGKALGAIAAGLTVREPDGILARLVRESGGEADAKLIEQAADAGDASAEAAIRQAGRYLGSALTSLVDIFNPEVVIIGGSLRKLGERFVGVAVEVMRREAYPQHSSDVTVVEAQLGDEAPALGAAVVAREMLQSS